MKEERKNKSVPTKSFFTKSSLTNEAMSNGPASKGLFSPGQILGGRAVKIVTSTEQELSDFLSHAKPNS